MGDMVWKEAYSVGNRTLDAQHQQLVELVNRLDGDAPLLTVLDDLADYADRHFSAEEALLESVDYPDLGRHKTQHQAFRAWLDLALQQQRSNEGCYATRDDIKAYLRVWIANHLLVYDMAFKPWVSGETAP